VASKVDKFETALRRLGLHVHWYKDWNDFEHKAADLWDNVMSSAAVAIGGGIAVKQMNENAGDTFILIGLGVTRHKAVK